MQVLLYVDLLTLWTLREVGGRGEGGLGEELNPLNVKGRGRTEGGLRDKLNP